MTVLGLWFAQISEPVEPGWGGLAQGPAGNWWHARISGAEPP